MMKFALVLAIGAAGGFVAGSFASAGPSPVDEAPSPVAYFDGSAPVAERLAVLERTVSEERNARLVLEEQITMLLEEIDRIDTAGPEVIASEIDQLLEGQRQNAERVEARQAREQMRRMSVRDRQLAALTAGGFPADRAGQILDRASALQWELMQEGYEARNGGQTFRGGLDANPEWRLRQEIGDDEYARYLDAMGRPTEISIQDVMASSPASRAGLESGDVIVAYNGTRIFNAAELRSFSMTGTPGTDAVVEILRDGNRMQLTLPAGPMGIQMGANRRGRGYRIRN